MSRLVIALLSGSLFVILIACGGDGGPSVYLVLEADLSALPADVDRDEVMDTIVETLERRAMAFGAGGVDIQREDAERVSLNLDDVISEEDARQLMGKRALLELRQPLLDEDGDIRCQAADDSKFSIAPDQVTYETIGVSALPVCRAGEEKSGEILWEPAIAVARHTQTLGVDAAIVQVANATVDNTRSPMVVVAFARDNAPTLEQLSERLLGLPLGIFLDGELLAGPTIHDLITTGSIVVAGLSLLNANILAAQLNAGELPVPVSAASAQEAP